MQPLHLWKLRPVSNDGEGWYRREFVEESNLVVYYRTELRPIGNWVFFDFLMTYRLLQPPTFSRR